MQNFLPESDKRILKKQSQTTTLRTEHLIALCPHSTSTKIGNVVKTKTDERNRRLFKDIVPRLLHGGHHERRQR